MFHPAHSAPTSNIILATVFDIHTVCFGSYSGLKLDKSLSTNGKTTLKCIQSFTEKQRVRKSSLELELLVILSSLSNSQLTELNSFDN